MLNRILIILVIIATTIGYSLYQKKSLDSQLSRGKETTLLKKLPAVEFTSLDGKPVRSADLTGKLLVVHFWGTWCGPCEAEMPELVRLAKQFETNPDVKFILVAVADDPIKVKKTIAALPKVEITWLLDNKDAYRDQFGTSRVPETYVFASDHTLIRKYIGPQEWNKPLFYQQLNDFLNTTKI